ncbi:hypothetical protein D3C87_1512290 [compost metagenome]
MSSSPIRSEKVPPVCWKPAGAISFNLNELEFSKTNAVFAGMLSSRAVIVISNSSFIPTWPASVFISNRIGSILGASAADTTSGMQISVVISEYNNRFINGRIVV